MVLVFRLSCIETGFASGVCRYFFAKDELKTAPALEENAGAVEVGERRLHRKFAGARIAGDVRLQSLLSGSQIGGGRCRGSLERLHSPDPLESAGDCALFSFGGGALP